MILFFSLVVFICLFINYRIIANKLNFYFIFKIFMEIKSISYVLVKLILGIIIFLFLNYYSYIYYSVGLTMHYGYVFFYAFAIVILL